jgi:hypothetical protein
MTSRHVSFNTSNSKKVSKKRTVSERSPANEGLKIDISRVGPAVERACASAAVQHRHIMTKAVAYANELQRGASNGNKIIGILFLS